MILLDWTRMGHSYCLAGVVLESNHCRVVRPLPGRNRKSQVRNVGWSPFTMEGHCRWEVMELVRPELADSMAPHLEDCWVQSLRPRRVLAPVEQRRKVLQGTLASAGEPLFGADLNLAQAGAFLKPGTGTRSLATVIVSSADLVFCGITRGLREAEIRVRIPLPDMGERQIPVKDHFLLQWAGQAGDSLSRQLVALNEGVRRMGAQVAVRVGLSRAFQTSMDKPGYCWLMADGFFSCAEPQP